MALRTLSSLGSLAGKRVLVRCDLNVPLKDGVITDDGRIRASLPTLNALLDQGARVVVMSHLGRPDGAPEAKYSLEPAAIRLGELLGALVEGPAELDLVVEDLLLEQRRRVGQEQEVAAQRLDRTLDPDRKSVV